MKYKAILLVVVLIGCSKKIDFAEQQSYVLHLWSSNNVPSERISEVQLSNIELMPLLSILEEGSEFEKVDSLSGDGVVLVGNDHYIVITPKYMFYIVRKYIDSVETFRVAIEPAILEKIKDVHGVRS